MSIDKIPVPVPVPAKFGQFRFRFRSNFNSGRSEHNAHYTVYTMYIVH